MTNGEIKWLIADSSEVFDAKTFYMNLKKVFIKKTCVVIKWEGSFPKAQRVNLNAAIKWIKNSRDVICSNTKNSQFKPIENKVILFSFLCYGISNE